MSAAVTALNSPPPRGGRDYRTNLACMAIGIMAQLNYGFDLPSVAVLRSLCRRLRGTRVNIDALCIAYDHLRRAAMGAIYANTVRTLSFTLYCPSSTIPAEYKNIEAIDVGSNSMLSEWFLDSIPPSCRRLSIKGRMTRSAIDRLCRRGNLQRLTSLMLCTLPLIVVPVGVKFGAPLLEVLELVGVAPDFSFVVAFDGLVSLAVEGLDNYTVGEIVARLPPSLRSLAISVSDVSDETLGPVVNTRLTHLRLQRCSGLTVNVIHSLPESLEALHLEDLVSMVDELGVPTDPMTANLTGLISLKSLAVINVPIIYYIIYLPASLKALKIVKFRWGGRNSMYMGGGSMFGLLPRGLTSLYFEAEVWNFDTVLLHTTIEDLTIRCVYLYHLPGIITECLPPTLTRLDVSNSVIPWGDITVFAGLKGLDTLVLGDKHRTPPDVMAVLRSSIPRVVG